ncbi:MAG TPA: PAS domain S-box protein [Terriglobales bacterium]|nr:PAS domain S-box protein [Terriglobales bacterium]
MLKEPRLRRALRIAAAALLLSTVFQALKHALFPAITIWESHIFTVLLFTLVAFAFSFAMLGREQRQREAIKAREHFLESVMQNLPGILCIFGTNGKFLRWNANLEVKLGYSTAELAQINALDTVLEEDRERVQQIMQSSLTSGAADGEVTLLHRDGKKIPCYITGTRIILDDQPCILGIAVDMTAQRKAQDQLRLQAAALRAAGNSIVIADRDGTIEWVNPAFTRMTGYAMEEAVSQNPRLLKSGRHGNTFYANLWSTISAGKVWHGEITNRRKDGTLYDEEMTITPVASNQGVISHYIAIKQDISARKQAETALQQAEEKYRRIFDEAIIGIFQSTPEGRFLMVNPALAKMLHCDSPAYVLEEVKDIAPLYGDPARRQEMRKQLEATGAVQNMEHQFRRIDGAELWVSLNLRCVYGKDGKPSYYEGTAEDITERKLLERQLQQAQKMEAIGRLAGGVAHDFNNMLGVINGYCEILKTRSDFDPTTLQQIEEIYSAGKKATSLTQQLLAFSRKQIIQPRITDLNEIVTNLSKMLRRLIGDDIELTMRLSSRLTQVKVDQGQIEQVLMNLAVNARDAMPGGGKLAIETDVCDLDGSYAMQHKPVRPGRYVRLTVADTGCGMDQETMSHLFEPFFTTKELGRGTGLGLSIVYGIVKQSDGYVWAYSEPGHGTSFKIYLPLQVGEAGHATEAKTSERLRGSENILLVEDDPSLRQMMAGFLKGLGYSVVEAENGESALAAANGSADAAEVLITDITMPKMSGRDLADRLVTRLPNLRVLYISGYTHDGVVQTRALSASEAFLQKPFALSELSKTLRELIAK